MGAPPSVGISTGTVIAGMYQVTEKIGQGGMGAVWAARHLRLPGKRVAIKVLRAGGADEQGLARFRREAEIASRIGHPNIVEVLDLSTLPDGTPYQVLEFLDGETLAARLFRGPLPVDEALELARQIGSALRAAHRAGVVHRDLKPDNIFLCPSDAGGVLHHRVKVLDFGISKIRGSQTVQTQESVLIGTPQYMSPEQASGRNSDVDHRTDVFALGAIVYEMIGGRAAFAGDGLMAVIMAVIHATPSPLAGLVPGLPDDVAAAVQRALAKDPAQRFSDVGDFVTALTGRPLQTLGDEAGPGGARTTGIGDGARTPSRPLSAEEINGETLAPGSGAAAFPTPPASQRTPSSPSPAPAPAPASGVAPGRSVAPTLVQNPPAAPASDAPAAPVPAPRRRAGLMGAGVAVVAAALVAAGIGLGGGRRASDEKPPTPGTPSIASDAPAVATPAVVVPPPPSIADAGTTARAAADAGGAAPIVAANPRRIAGEAAPTHRRAENLPPDVAEQLAEAERLLAAGDAGEAVRRARQSFFVKKTVRGFGVLTRAFCAKGDLENARASFRNLPAGSPERVQAVRDCHARGVELR